ncbi:MAG: flagellar motor protein MotB [Lachnospiraceae bacterium]|nr:flagellar motor protein MotB [Lachnospiraceae bacterium]MBR4175513.1 flagellar motor protein MotB [Lachnospiraceae bacterium]
MAKRKEDAPAPGSPAWMATFGDLMNLLLCFFVLLFSMSSVDAQKFELIAASFSQTFSVLSGGASAIGEGMLISNGVSQLNELSEYINSMGSMSDAEGLKSFGEESSEDTQSEELKAQYEQEQLKEAEMLAERIQEAVEEQNIDKEVDVNFTSQYVLLTMNGALLFDSGHAEIREDAYPLLQKIARILERYAKHTIEVEGHTDNVPLNGGRFENNDVLSSYRALSVFNYILENTSLDPANIKHSGRGEYLPIADNSTPEGRAKNRRVEIKIFHSLSAE